MRTYYELQNLLNKHGKRLYLASFYLLFAVIALLLLRNLLFFLVLTILTGAVVFIINRLRSPFDLSPIFFSSVVLMHFYDARYVIAFLFLASVFPSILGGSTADFISFLSLLTIFLISYFSAFFPLELPYTIILAAVYALSAFFIIFTLTKEPGKALATFLVLLAVNMAYFTAFTNIFLTVGNIIIAG